MAVFMTQTWITLCGTTAMIRCKCPAGHMRRFCTSGEVNNVLSNNFQAAARLKSLQSLWGCHIFRHQPSSGYRNCTVYLLLWNGGNA